MIEDEKELKDFLENINEKDIIFKQHFYEKKEKDRKYLTEELIISSLKDMNKLQGFQK